MIFIAIVAVIILLGIVFITTEIHRMSTALDALKAAVAENTSVTESAIVLLDGLKTKLDEALASDDPPAAIQEIADSIEAEKRKLADAITRNTPSQT